MAISSSTSRSFVVSIAALMALVAPAVAFAKVSITEIMYDAPGSDQGHEWVEISADAPTDISGWRFVVDGDNHLIAVVEGTTSLAAGQIAVISNDPQTFLTDFPNYTGALFKSSFSLLNTGGTVALKDKKLNVIDSATYAASMGAAGDGNSLHLAATSWIPGAPNPGSLSATKAIAPPPKVIAVKTSAKSPTKSLGNTSAADYQPASTVLAQPLALPVVPRAWLYVLGGLALLALVACAVLYAWPLHAATSGPAAEFELE